GPATERDCRAAAPCDWSAGRRGPDRCGSKVLHDSRNGSNAIFCHPLPSIEERLAMSRLRACPDSSRPLPESGRTASNDAAAKNPCLSCGACCAHFRVSFYCGEIADDNGAGMVPPELAVQIAPLRAAMKV